jgi:hypothetical protein
MCLFRFGNDSVSVAIIGDYTYDEPTVGILASLEHLLQYFIDNKWVTRDYRLMGLCELHSTKSPGKNLYYKLIDNCNSTSKSSYWNTCKHLVSKTANNRCCNCDKALAIKKYKQLLDKHIETKLLSSHGDT